MKLKCILVSKELGYKFEFDYINHTYQDESSYYNLSKDDYDKVVMLTKTLIFMDFKALIKLDADFEKGLLTDEKDNDKRKQYMDKIYKYIDSKIENSIFEIIRIDDVVKN